MGLCPAATRLPGIKKKAGPLVACFADRQHLSAVGEGSKIVKEQGTRAPHRRGFLLFRAPADLLPGTH